LHACGGSLPTRIKFQRKLNFYSLEKIKWFCDSWHTEPYPPKQTTWKNDFLKVVYKPNLVQIFLSFRLNKKITSSLIRKHCLSPHIWYLNPCHLAHILLTTLS
jgi:hypothetical protein